MYSWKRKLNILLATAKLATVIAF